MFIKFICCDVFTRIACDVVAKSPHVVDVEFIPMMEHTNPDNLRLLIQHRIEMINQSDRPYDALVLGFGLCGNSVVGLTASIPMIVPRAHDCCTIHMGSKERFLDIFKDKLSARWGSTGYHERTAYRRDGLYVSQQHESYKTSVEYMGYVEKFGEEEAEYLWETMHPEIETDEAIYIEIDEFEYSDAKAAFQRRIEYLGKQVEVVRGDKKMLEALVNGEWDNKQFLTIAPGQRIAGVYDMDQVMQAAD